MQTECCKEREGLLSPPQTPWWNAFGSQPLTPERLAGDAAESCAEVKVTTLETEQGVAKQSSATLFTFSNVGGKSSRDVSKPHVPMQSACFEFGFVQPMIYTKHPHVEQYYGVVSPYGSHVSSSQVTLPLKLETEEDGTVYVNSKQYNAIIRRRQSRAKAIFENKLSRCRKQPYMHHSRHLHAMRRLRGSSGRFLNTKKADAAKQTNSRNSQSFDVFHPQNGTMNSSSKSYGPNLSGSEVTSMDEFQCSSVHSLGGMVIPSKWISSAMDIGCCNLKT